MMNHRYTLERAIIGAALLEGNIGLVTHILRPKNFKNSHFRAAYSIMLNMWPTKVIDLITVNHQFRKLNQSATEFNTEEFEGFSFSMAEAMSCVSQSSHIESHAFLLLEESLKWETIQELKNHLNIEDIHVAADIEEVVQNLHHSEADILSLIIHIYRYFKAKGIDLSHLKYLDEQMVAKAKMIQNINRIEIATKELNKLKLEQETLEHILAQKQQPAA